MNTSWVTSSAVSGPIMRRTRLWTRAACERYRRSNALPSPLAARAASATSASSARPPVALSGSLRSVATPGQVRSIGTGLDRTSGVKVGTYARLTADMGPLLAPAGLGLLLGLRHAFEPDHLAAEIGRASCRERVESVAGGAS